MDTQDKDGARSQGQHCGVGGGREEIKASRGRCEQALQLPVHQGKGSKVWSPSASLLYPSPQDPNRGRGARALARQLLPECKGNPQPWPPLPGTMGPRCTSARNCPHHARCTWQPNASSCLQIIARPQSCSNAVQVNRWQGVLLSHWPVEVKHMLDQGQSPPELSKKPQNPASPKQLLRAPCSRWKGT